MGCVAEVAERRASPCHRPVGPALRRVGLWALSCPSAHIRACCRARGASSLLEPSPQCRPSVLAFIAPLAESLRAELSAIQDTIAQTGSTAHMYSAALATLADKVDALVALASDLDLRARDSSEQEHAKGFGTLMISSISGTERGEDLGVFWTDSGPRQVTHVRLLTRRTDDSQAD